MFFSSPVGLPMMGAPPMKSPAARQAIFGPLSPRAMRFREVIPGHRQQAGKRWDRKPMAITRPIAHAHLSGLRTRFRLPHLIRLLNAQALPYQTLVGSV